MMPDLSVIIATYNRARMLDRTLQDLVRLECRDVTWELIVVDNNSNDDTAEIARGYANRLPIHYVWEARQGKNFAVNAAVERASGELLVFADDDVSPTVTWLDEIKRASRRWPDSAVFGGRIVPRFPPGTPRFLTCSDFTAYVYAGLDLGERECLFPRDEYPNGPNCWVRRSVFDQGIRFDTNIGPSGRGRVAGSESELFVRLSALGQIPVYVPSATVAHRIQAYQTTTRYLLRRAYAMGRGHVRIHGNSSFQGKRILGVPRYFYRQALEAGLRVAGCAATWRFKRSFEEAMRCAELLGCIHESHRTRVGDKRGSPRSTEAVTD